jgi:hypothetical protein
MISKRKRLNRAWPPSRSESEEFLWHLLPPWLGEYSHKHWWGNDTQNVEREAVIWEILRRHPYSEWFLIESLVDWNHDEAAANWSPHEQLFQENLDVYWQRRRKKFLDLIRLSPAFSWRRREKDIDLMLAAYACRSWVELPKREQKRWRQELSEQLDSQHGFRAADGAYAVDVIPNIESLSDKFLAKLRAAAKCYYSSRGNNKSLASIWERESCGNADNQFALGRILVAFDPYVPNIEGLVAKRVRVAVRKWRCLFPKPFDKSPMHRSPGRLRIQDWLAIIRNFEQTEMDRDPRTKRDDQLFARYRRIIGSWIL